MARNTARRHGYTDSHVGADYTDDERELLQAVDRYRTKKRLNFVTCTEVLAILKQMGYRREKAETPPQTKTPTLLNT